jgi:hypothetical protein
MAYSPLPFSLLRLCIKRSSGWVPSMIQLRRLTARCTAWCEFFAVSTLLALLGGVGFRIFTPEAAELLNAAAVFFGLSASFGLLWGLMHLSRMRLSLKGGTDSEWHTGDLIVHAYFGSIRSQVFGCPPVRGEVRTLAPFKAAQSAR